MNEKFKSIIEQLPVLFSRLINSPLKPWSNLGTLPQKGIYVFYEDGKAIYVGRTNRMKDRIKEHGRPSSTHNSATFSFILAKKAWENKGIDIKMPRVSLEKDPSFIPLFMEAKERVTKMAVHVIEINDPILQTIFEVYASMELKTELNDFDTH
jgi:excinuclease UvrABC nuclease subunit